MQLADNIMTGESVASKAAIFAFSILSPCSLSAPITHPASSSSLLSLIILHHAPADEARLSSQLSHLLFSCSSNFMTHIHASSASRACVRTIQHENHWKAGVFGKARYRCRTKPSCNLLAWFLDLKKHGSCDDCCMYAVCSTVLYKFHCLRKTTCWHWKRQKWGNHSV